MSTTVSANDRLVFTLIIAALLHAILILGIQFRPEERSANASALEVTLAISNDDFDNKEADFQAQFSQKGSGTADEILELTTDKDAEFDSNLIQEATPFNQSLDLPRVDTERHYLTSLSSSAWPFAISEVISRDLTGDSEQTDQLQLESSLDIASLKALIDDRRQQYANKPRVKTLTSTSTQSSIEAAYLLYWLERIESIGNLNYPEAAKQRRLSGDVRLMSRIRNDGSIQEIKLLSSSGHPVLDDAAKRIVALAAPFKAFDDQLAKDYDVLEIIRTFKFEVDRTSLSQ